MLAPIQGISNHTSLPPSTLVVIHLLYVSESMLPKWYSRMGCQIVAIQRYGVLWCGSIEWHHLTSYKEWNRQNPTLFLTYFGSNLQYAKQNSCLSCRGTSHAKTTSISQKPKKCIIIDCQNMLEHRMQVTKKLIRAKFSHMARCLT